MNHEKMTANRKQDDDTVSTSSWSKSTRTPTSDSDDGKTCMITVRVPDCECRLIRDDPDDLTGWSDGDDVVARLKGDKQRDASRNGKRKSKQSQKWSYRYANNTKNRQPEEVPGSAFQHHGDLRKYITDYRNSAMSARAVHVRGGIIPVLGESVPDPYMSKLKSMGDGILERISLLSEIAKETERTQRIIHSHKSRKANFLKLPKVELKDGSKPRQQLPKDSRRTKSASEVEEQILRLPKISEDIEIEDLENPDSTRSSSVKAFQSRTSSPLKLPEIRPVTFTLRPGKHTEFVLKMALKNQYDVKTNRWVEDLGQTAKNNAQNDVTKELGNTDSAQEDSEDRGNCSGESALEHRKQTVHLAQTRHNTKQVPAEPKSQRDLPSLRTGGNYHIPAGVPNFAFVKGNRLNGAIPEPRRKPLACAATPLASIEDSWYSSFSEETKTKDHFYKSLLGKEKAVPLDPTAQFMRQALSDPALCRQYLTRLEAMRQIFELRSPPPKVPSNRSSAETRPLGSCKNQKKYKQRPSLTPTEQAKETLSKLGVLGNQYRTKDAHEAHFATIRPKNIPSTHVTSL